LVAGGADTKGIATDQVGPGGNYVPIVNNALSFIVNPGANPKPTTWDDLLAPQYKGKLQYSTPGQAGDGTAVLVLLQQLRGKPAALDYLTKLQANNVGPSSSTGKLQPKVSNGELLVANGDVQMNLDSIKNDGSKFEIFFPAGADGKRTTISVPYVAGVTKGAPHEESAKKLLGFLLSDDVQKTVEPDALGIPVRDQIRTASAESPLPNTPAAVLNGVDVWVPDWNSVLSELDADVAAYQKATGN
jgi:2-aminoethylphosphonate transport system substrate-binding protein